MEDVCIVCNRAIVWSSAETEGKTRTHASASSTRSNGSSSPVSADTRQSSHPGAGQAALSHDAGPAGSGGDKQQQQPQAKEKKSHHTHAHHPAVRGHHHARIKRNQSHGKLHAKSGIKPLTSTASSTAIAANAAAISAAVAAIVANGAQHDTSTEGPSDAITSENLPDWMAIYCSEECRNEDELRSRLSFANLNEERERSLSKLAALQAQSSNGHTGPGRAYSNASLSPTFGPQGLGNRGTPSPWYNDSEGSEFDWHHKEKDGHQHAHGQSSSLHASRHRATSSRDSSDIIATSGSEGRRFSDASDSSRLSSHHRQHLRHAPVPTLHNPHARRSSSRTRGSHESLASLGSSHYDYSSSGGNGQQIARPDIGHRSNSALGGLRAMTPIHHQQQTTSTSASPRLTSPNRTASSSKLYPSATSPTTSSDMRAEVTAPSTSSGTTASILIQSNNTASTSNTHNRGNNNAENGSATGSLGNLASSTYIAPSSAKTFRPASVSRSTNGSGFLKPSKSSATLALSPAENIRATMVAERPSSHSPARRPANAMSRNHSNQQHRTSHHISTSSIPYLSCSPSSPGSGSINSGRSNVSTDPSSSSVRGEGEYYDDYAGGDISDDGEYKPLPRKSEDDERNGGTASLASYGLFYQRTPSTPSLPSLAHQYSSSYGRSPPIGPHSFGSTRSSRLSASFDTKNINTTIGSTTISSVFRERQNNSSKPALAQNSHSHSSTLRMTPSNGVYSPRRATFDINAAYQNPHHPAPVRNHSSGRLHPPSSAIGHHQPDNTPTQGGLASRSHSFIGHYGRTVVQPPHEVVHQVAKDQHGRTRAPSITRTDLERVASDRSIGSGSGRPPSSGGVEDSRSSSSTLQRLPSHLRPATLSPRNTSDLALPSPPISPGLYNHNSRSGSHSAMHQIVEDSNNGGYGRPLLANARSKSRSSFTWDHLPPYVPQYAALDLDKVRRNKSGTSLHSVYEDDSEQALSSVPSSTQSTVKSAQQTSSRKRLFYFPEAE